MSVKAPKFIDSKYFVDEPDNWHLKPGAPVDVQKEFDAWMAEQQEANDKGIFL